MKGLGTLVADLGLFDEITNPHFEPEALRAPEPLAETFGAIGRFLVSTPQVFGLLGDILGALLSPEMRLDDVDLELVQYILGGDIEGAKLAPRKAGTSQAKKAVTAAGKTQGTKSKQTKDGKDTERRIDTNKVSIWIRPAEGRLGLELDSLDLASLMHIMPGMSVRTGKATLRGLRIVTDFSDRGTPRRRRIARRRADRHHRHRSGDRRDARGRHPPDAPAAAPQGRPERGTEDPHRSGAAQDDPDPRHRSAARPRCRTSSPSPARSPGCRRSAAP